jgi:hypothetical protein
LAGLKGGFVPGCRHSGHQDDLTKIELARSPAEGKVIDFPLALNLGS